MSKESGPKGRDFAFPSEGQRIASILRSTGVMEYWKKQIKGPRGFRQIFFDTLSTDRRPLLQYSFLFLQAEPACYHYYQIHKLGPALSTRKGFMK
jgi:hypothetical protein